MCNFFNPQIKFDPIYMIEWNPKQHQEQTEFTFSQSIICEKFLAKFWSDQNRKVLLPPESPEIRSFSATLPHFLKKILANH